MEQLAGERPDAVGYRHVPIDGDDRAVSWAELAHWSGHLSVALAGRGLGPGDRLAIGLRNSPAFATAVLAAWRLGAVPVPVRWDLPTWEHTRVLDVIDAPVVLGADDLDWIAGTARHRGAPPPPSGAVAPNMHGICSSGSTGTPKVILNNQPAFFTELYATPLAESWGPVPRPQTILVLAPMYHVNGFATLQNMLAGDTVVVMEKFDAARAVDVIERHRITTFTATPTMLQRIADLPGVDGRDLSSIEWILQGAAPMPPSLVHRWIDLVGATRLVMAYGMTEGLGLTALRGDEWLAHPGSVGRGIKGTEVRILGVDGEPLEPGGIGDVYLRSAQYHGATYLGGAALPPPTDDGFRTAGDMGHLDGDGYLHLADRRVDLIITGGANVFPAEVEAALIDHPAIADVVVIGLRDDEWGRRVHAVIEPRDPAAPPASDDVIAWAKGRLAAYKVPKTVEFVTAIPRSAATKVSRGSLVAERGG